MTTPAGRINKLFGTDGGVMLSLYPAFPEAFDTDMPLLVTIDGLEVPLYCERFVEFRIELHEEGDDDEFYLEDLIGFAVEAEETGSGMKVSGTLTDYYDSDTNPLFELEIDGRQVLIPAAEEFIAHIDFEGRRIHFVLPEGLLDLE